MLVEKIKQLGLYPTTRREVTLFTISCIGEAYVKLLKHELGFSYNGLGVLGNGNNVQFLMNEQPIIDGMAELLEKNNPLKILEKAKQIYQDVKLKFEEKDTKLLVSNLIEDYPKYFLAIGIYNGFWRYIGNENRKGKLTEDVVKQISKERDEISKLYPKVDKRIRDISNLHEYKNMKYLMVSEIRKRQFNSISERKNYFYLYHDKEYLTTDIKEIEEIKRFISQNISASNIKGHVAYPGNVKGIVFNPDSDSKIIIPANDKFILVKHGLHPDDTPVLKRCIAIVTDEGGVLSHSAHVAREMKIPSVIGTKFASQIFKTGDIIEIKDGAVTKIT